jgi:ABC-type branched-subunit amino acid transport system substrate-binding protein
VQHNPVKQKRVVIRAAAAAVCALALAACGSASGSGSVSGGSPVKIGMLTAETGPLAGQFAGEVAGARARVAEANAAGGISGRQVQLVLADDQSTQQGAFTAAQSLVSQGVAGVLCGESFVDGPAEQYLAQNHIPLAASASSPQAVNDENLFNPVGTYGPLVPASKSLGNFLSGLGVRKMAGLTWGNVAEVVADLDATLASTTAAGIKTVVKDLSPTPATVDYAPYAAEIRASGAQSVILYATNDAAIRLAVALQQQGVHLKAPIWTTILLDDSILTDPHESAFEGSYVQSEVAPPTLQAAAVKRFVATLKEYEPGTYPGFEATYGYVLADVLLTGAAGAGHNITGPAVFASLQKITSYTGAGLIPRPMDFAKPKTDPQNLQNCYWYTKIENRNFIPVSENPVC